MNLANILKDSNYKLSQFEPEEINWLKESIFLKKTKKGDTAYIKCLVRNKDIQLKPEEAIRQLYFKVLCDRYGYPVDRMIVEYPVKFGRETKKADIAIMDRERPQVPYIIVELKKPKEKDGKEQLKSYCNATGAPIGVWTNGDGISRWHRMDPNYFERITDIPGATQTLEDILQIKFTLEDLIENDRLVQEKKSLRSLIEEMEDEVLANAGVDVFEEVFKLIFTKLYDEWLSGQEPTPLLPSWEGMGVGRILEFRNTGQTEGALKSKIQKLFDRAKEKWEGVFDSESKISLTPSHLAVCVRSLENVKLFNSNLDVIDEAFEYLVNQSSKGEKGQYFTPRYVIDMCVKMLNPKEHEYMIDTAAGSSGFPVHTIFHVWKQILEEEGLTASHLFTMENKPHRCYEYVQKRVFAMDFDERSVRVARTLNLIAGDGQTNVLHLNTLDFDLWDEITKQEEWNDTYNEGFKGLKKLRGEKDSNKEFRFDVLMANPPFAGDIKESRLIARYNLGKKPNGKWQTKVGRDILFIERNLDFLQPGGRMAIILPQGRFNNSSDKYIRDYIAQRCRILAVVGLHGNTFKPHTGTKTSVLFVQKWNDDLKIGPLCPRQDDYNIFFATMRKSGKDNSGEKIYRHGREEKDGEFLLDNHGHLIVDHDLYNHDGLTEDGIAEAFIEFAKKEELSFFELSLSVAPFDAQRYKGLMDGLEAVEVLFSETLENKDFRIDSEFHHKPPVQNPNYNYVDVGDHLTLVQYGISIGMNEEGEGTKIYRMNEIHNMLCDIEVSKFADISSTEIKAFKLTDRDILFNRTNSFDFVGRTGLFRSFSNESFVFASYLVRVRTDESKILPEYLVAFLNSSLGIWDIKRRARISINQSNVNAQELAAVKIPLLSLKFQSRLKELFEQAHQDRLKAIQIYQQAEDLLLSELGLKNWQPTDENIAIKSFSASFGMSGRLDAEYYQPFYEEVEQKIKSREFVLVQDICSHINYGSVPTSPYSENGEGIPYIKGLNIKKTEILTDSLDRIVNTEKLSSKFFTKKGDIIIYQMGTVGNCGVVGDEQVGWIFASFTIRIRIKNQKLFNPHFVAFYIEKVAKPYYLMRNIAQASVRQNTDLPTIRNIYIPVVSEKIQISIVAKLQKYKQLKQQSKQLLEIAKTGVERAIEENEERARAWMNQQLNTLGIEWENTH